ncbi:hypothetical protein Despr_2606 [Desulfobulbus propionicus DSM 2032]|uniref:Uncharacterized protein n=1 Tax=Desulfobulbus propionicus (strain ATCC 33891 / DSM 2032 / VKM B-1956 / 1pr3) TaxID=577650 RepID=A0A7U4DQ48_DESPD|nr:hypothetical protein [Desulfobulbus propionicus]ADW18742.1 hypothetical protein Despr_2606 [Desulfobulbus propionicus DSM 2032]
MNLSNRQSLLEEEWLLVRHSGEIPEVALHASFYYLCEDEEGPGLVLSQVEKQTLESAALHRYQEIILRDLDVANRDLSLFRGIRRANHNWYRFVRFSDKVGSSLETFQAVAADALLHYLRQEQDEVSRGERLPSINCSAHALLTFAVALGIDPSLLPENWADLCEQAP